jgi:hypothetical protein
VEEEEEEGRNCTKWEDLPKNEQCEFADCLMH